MSRTRAPAPRWARDPPRSGGTGSAGIRRSTGRWTPRPQICPRTGGAGRGCVFTCQSTAEALEGQMRYLRPLSSIPCYRAISGRFSFTRCHRDIWHGVKVAPWTLGTSVPSAKEPKGLSLLYVRVFGWVLWCCMALGGVFWCGRCVFGGFRAWYPCRCWWLVGWLWLGCCGGARRCLRFA